MTNSTAPGPIVERVFVGDDQRHGFTKRLADDFTPTTWLRPEKLLKSFRGDHVFPIYFMALKYGLGGGESCVTFYDRMVTQTALEYLANQIAHADRTIGLGHHIYNQVEQ